MVVFQLDSMDDSPDCLHFSNDAVSFLSNPKPNIFIPLEFSISQNVFPNPAVKKPNINYISAIPCILYKLMFNSTIL